MDWITVLNEIFQVCIIPLLGLLTTYLIKYISAKSNQIMKDSDDALVQKYIDLLDDTIIDCVLATNQTYVEALKNKNAFDLEAQKAAFDLTYKAVMNIINDDAKVYLSFVYGDLTAYITKKIEAEVNKNKITPIE